MIETLLQLDPTTITTAQLPLRDDRPDASAFSFDAAVVSLEGRAAQSLQSFGAQPEQNSLTNPTRSNELRAPDPTQTPSRIQSNPNTGLFSAPADPLQPIIATTNTAASTTPLPTVGANTGPSLVPITISTAGATTPSTLQTTQSSIQHSRPEAPATRTSEVQQFSRPNRNAAATAQRSPETAANDFARVLARRLTGGATQFEVRLDPPELGRVEAQLRVSDKGEALVALSFEHEATLDLFLRDESELRSQLEFAGFDLDGKQLSFSVAEGTDTDPASILDTDPDAAQLDIPDAYAAYSSGVLDLKV